MYDRKENEPVGYVYKADTYCDVCVPVVVQRRFVGPAAEVSSSPFLLPLPDKETAWEWVQRLGRMMGVDVEDEIMGVDVEDETTYDSGDFPKMIWGWMEGTDKTYCGLCREPLVDQENTKGRWLP